MKKQDTYNNIIQKAAIEFELNELEINSVSKCKCGALTVYFDNGEYNSMRPSTFKKVFNKSVPKLEITTYCCNHCINGYGIDLCHCGSRKKVGFCHCDSNEPREEIGEAVVLSINLCGKDINFPKKVNLQRI